MTSHMQMNHLARYRLYSARNENRWFLQKIPIIFFPVLFIFLYFYCRAFLCESTILYFSCLWKFIISLYVSIIISTMASSASISTPISPSTGRESRGCARLATNTHFWITSAVMSFSKKSSTLRRILSTKWTSLLMDSLIFLRNRRNTNHQNQIHLIARQAAHKPHLKASCNKLIAQSIRLYSFLSVLILIHLCSIILHPVAYIDDCFRIFLIFDLLFFLRIEVIYLNRELHCWPNTRQKTKMTNLRTKEWPQFLARRDRWLELWLWKRQRIYTIVRLWQCAEKW